MAREKSRTAYCAINSKVSLAFYFVNIVLEFISRKVFIDMLGTDVVGLNTTAYNLLGFLNLAELGVGAAVAFTLYKPLFNKDINSINEIVTLQGWLYRRIAGVIIIGAVALMALFPLIFGDMALPMWYSFASFGVLLYSALLTYFINYKQIVLSADQKHYKILFSYKAVLMLGVLSQILCIHFLDHGYIWWLALQVVFPTLAAVSLNFVIRRECPFLAKTAESGRSLAKKYPVIITKIKQVFFHKISGYVLLQTSPLVVYAYTSLEVVAIYGNYLLISTGIRRLLDAVFGSINASVGNLIAQGDIKRIYSVFEEMFSGRFVVVAAMCFSVYVSTDSLINIWLGEKFILNHVILGLLVYEIYINVQRPIVNAFTMGYGMYQDVWAACTEATLNIGLSILLGYFFGLEGVICGVIISLVLICEIWKPIFLYRWGFHISMLRYVKMYAIHIAAAAVAWCVCYMAHNLLFDATTGHIPTFVASCAFAFCSFFLLCTALTAASVKAQRLYLKRLAKVIFKK